MKSINALHNQLTDVSSRFSKQLTDAPDEIKAAFRESLALFLADPTHPALRNHALTEKFAGYRSINVTEDWRAVFREEQNGECENMERIGGL